MDFRNHVSGAFAAWSTPCAGSRTVTSDRAVYNDSSLSFYDIAGWKRRRINLSFVLPGLHLYILETKKMLQRSFQCKRSTSILPDAKFLQFKIWDCIAKNWWFFFFFFFLLRQCFRAWGTKCPQDSSISRLVTTSPLRTCARARLLSRRVLLRSPFSRFVYLGSGRV